MKQVLVVLPVGLLAAVAAGTGVNVGTAQAQSSAPSDLTAPTVVIDTPRNGVTYAQAQLAGGLIQGRARDNLGGSGVAGVAVVLSREVSGVVRYYDGRGFNLASGRYVVGTTTGSGDLKSWSLRLPTAAQGLLPGIYRVRALARDLKGNSGTSALATFAVRGAVVSGDRIAPSITIEAPQNGGVYPVSTYFGAQGSAQDNAGGGGIASVHIIAYRYADANGPAGYFNGRDFSSRTPIENAARVPATTSNQKTSWLFVPTPLVFTAGRIQIQAIARDRVGNRSVAALTYTRR